MATRSTPLPRATLSQVAALAGVSLKTASRVVNDEPYVTQATAARVRAAADQLGYQPNALAREFRSGASSPSVGLLIGDVSNPFYARIARGAELRLRDAGLRLVSASTDEDPVREQDLVDEMIERRVSGLMIVTASAEHSYVEGERRRGTPVVFLDRAPVDVLADTIVLDNARGIAQAVEHLVERGHRRIGLIGDLARLSTQHERLAAFREAMRAAGLDGDAYVRTDCHDVDAAAEAARALLAHPLPPTALIATNNLITVGALRVLVDREDPPAIVGFDDFDLADLMGVSVIAHDPERMGAAAAEAVLARLRGDKDVPATTVLPTELIIRRSSEESRSDPGQAERPSAL